MKTLAKTTALSPRAVAADILVQLFDQGLSLSSLLPVQQSKVSPQDQPLVQEICFGVCRVLPRLELIIQQLVDKPLKGKTRIVHCLLLVGLYQLLYMRIPPHASVCETVNAVKPLKRESFRALVNGVLRRFLRQQAEILAKVDSHETLLHPQWLVNKLKQAYPQQWAEIIQANNQKPPMWLRINPQYTDVASYQNLLTQPSFRHQHPQALRLATATNVNQLAQFEEGWATVQDLNTQWAALWLDPQPQELILDACAAPGGKTTHILELAPQARVVALDIEAKRLVRVEQNLKRLNQQATVLCADASRPETWFEQTTGGEQFDRILLDAPCSATGVIRRHPDIKWLRKASDISALVQLQRQILTALWSTLKPNGVLLYATCSLLPEENQQQIAQFLQQTPDAQLEPIALAGLNNVADIGVQFLPDPQGGDGFYYAKLRKTA